MKAKLLLSSILALIIFYQIDFHGLECKLVYKYQTSNEDAFKELRIYKSITIIILIFLFYLSISIFQRMKKITYIIFVCLLSYLSIKAQDKKDLYADSIKQILIGEWKYQDKSLEMSLAEHLDFYEEIPDFAKSKLSRIAGVKIEDSLKIIFTSEDKFVISNKDQEIRYQLSIYEEEFWISRSDYVITIYYKFNESGNLVLTEKSRAGKSKIKLKKE